MSGYTVRPPEARLKPKVSAFINAKFDKIAALNAQHVLPTHSAVGTGALVAMEKQFIADLRRSALELKGKGVSVEDAGKQLSESFKAKYPDWPSMNVAGFVRNIYTE